MIKGGKHINGLSAKQDWLINKLFQYSCPLFAEELFAFNSHEVLADYRYSTFSSLQGGLNVLVTKGLVCKNDVTGYYLAHEALRLLKPSSYV